LNSVNQFPNSGGKRKDSKYHQQKSTRKFANCFSKENSRTHYSNKLSWKIKFIETTDKTVTASLNAVAHMVFSKEGFMTECEAIEPNEPKSSFKNHNSIQNERTVTHKKSHRIRCRSATQENGTTKYFYCTEHGQNPTHPAWTSVTL
jgi:hypothetical protein